MKISSSFLASKNIEKTISMLDVTNTDYVHVDFIKGKFVIGKEIPFRKLKKTFFAINFCQIRARKPIFLYIPYIFSFNYAILFVVS